MSSKADHIANRTDAKRVITTLRQKLDSDHVRYTEALKTMPIAYQGDAHGFMCIRLSGYLEQIVFYAVTGILKEYGEAGAYALTHFNRSPNLTPESLIKLIGRFGDRHREDIENFLDQNSRRETLGLLLSVRNRAAHGESYPGSRPSVENYKTLCTEISNWVLRDLLKA